MNWEILSSFLSFIFSALGIGIAIYSIHVSNKQSLFDKRIESYRVFSELYSTYKRNEDELLQELKRAKESDNKMLFNSGRYLRRMSSTSLLYGIHDILGEMDDKTVAHPGNNAKLKFDFYKKENMLRNSVVTLKFLFKKTDQSYNITTRSYDIKFLFKRKNLPIPIIFEFVNTYADYLHVTFEHYSSMNELSAIKRKQAQNKSHKHSNNVDKKKKQQQLSSIAREIGIDSDLAFLLDNNGTGNILQDLHTKAIIANKIEIISKIERLKELSDQIKGENVLDKIEKKIRL